MNNKEIDIVIRHELKDLINFVNNAKQDRILGVAVSFEWKIIGSFQKHETIIEFNLEAYNPIRMKFMLNDITSEKILITMCTKYKELIFRYTIFGR